MLGLLLLGTIIVGSSSASNAIRNTHQSKPVSGNRLIFCYYSSYAIGRPSIGKFTPEDIDPTLCTHIIFAFVNLVDGTHLEPASWNDVGAKGLYSRTQALKNINPNVKILLAVGGWTVGSDPFIPMISNPNNRRAFVHDVVDYLRSNGFDGLDMDWEFPGARGSEKEHKFLFTELLKELQTAFQQETRGREKLLLTMATAGGSYFINKAYETTKVAQHVDYLLLMAYNYHGSWNNFTGHHSGLYPRSDEIGAMKELNQEWTAEWERQGVPRSKLVMGIATYGMSFTLRDENQHGLGAPSNGGGAPGMYTQESGILSYYEVCENLKGPWNYVWIEEQKSPYAYYKDQWVGFDDQHSVRYKAEFIRHNGYAGAFIWSLEMEDFRGVCGEGKFPLLTTIHNILRPYTEDRQRTLQSSPVRHKERQSHAISRSHPVRRIKATKQAGRYIDTPNFRKTPAPKIQIPQRPVDMFKCVAPGIHEDPASCDRYFVCIMAGHQWKLYRMKCPEGLGFDPFSKSCTKVSKRC